MGARLRSKCASFAKSSAKNSQSIGRGRFATTSGRRHDLVDELIVLRIDKREAASYQRQRPAGRSATKAAVTFLVSPNGA